MVLLVLFLAGCDPAMTESDTTKLTISAASSMSESLMEVKEKYEAENPHIEIYFNFGGTGSLRRQIEQGAPVDLFFIASRRDYQSMIDDGLLSVTDFLFGNRMVAIQRAESSYQSLEALFQSTGRIAIATPGAAPAGTYAKQAFETLGAWDRLFSKDRFVYAKDARHVGHLVKKGAVEAGVIYQSDSVTMENIEVIEMIDATLHQTIEYYIGIVADSETEAAQDFYEFVFEEEIMKIFEKYGFVLANESGKLGEQ